MGLNPESEISNVEAPEPGMDPSSSADQARNRASDPANVRASPERSEEPARSEGKETRLEPGKEPVPSATSGPDPAPSSKKRKYNISDKVRASSPTNLKQARKTFVFTPARRAASMKNLEKANAAPPEKRNRLTERRLVARYANLCLAHLKLGPPGKRSPSHIYNGLHCRHLEHSLALAGEEKAKLEAHRDRFQGAFRPRDREESRFVRGMADAAWRLLRVFGARFRWEMRAVQYLLLLAINRRQSGQKMEPDEARALAIELLLHLGKIDRLQAERQILQKRLEQLARAFLEHRMGAPSSLSFFTREGSRLPHFGDLPDFALGNPYLGPKEAQKAAEQEASGAKKLKDAKNWAKPEDAPLFAPKGLSEQEKILRHQLLQAAGFNDELDEAGLKQMLELAFGIDFETGNSKLETREDGHPSPVVDGEGEPVSNFEFRVSSSEPSSIKSLATALWKRLALLRNWRESEALELDDILEQASGPQGVETWEPKPPQGSLPSLWEPEAEDESPHWQWRALAALMLSVFASDMVMMSQALVLAQGLRRGFYNFLVRHYRHRQGFNPLRADPRYERSEVYGPEDAGFLLLVGRYANGVKVTVRRE